MWIGTGSIVILNICLMGELPGELLIENVSALRAMFSDFVAVAIALAMP